MTPESKKLLNQFANALSSEKIYGESDIASMKRCREYSAKTEAARNALEEYIEKLEQAAPEAPAAASVKPWHERITEEERMNDPRATQCAMACEVVELRAALALAQQSTKEKP